MKRLTASITGGTGFLGRHLIEHLLKRDIQIKILTRNVAAVPSDFLRQGVSAVEGSLSDRGALTALTIDADWVFHLAAEIKRPELMNETNVNGTKNLLEAIRGLPVKRFIYLSSAGVCGQNKTVFIDEKSTCEPVNEYEKTKLEAELIVWGYSRNFNIPVSALRPTNIFGEGKNDPTDSFYRLFGAIKRKKYFLLDGGKGIANYIYVKDVADALLTLAENDKAVGECFLINDPTTVKDLSEKAKECMGVSYKCLNLPSKPVLYASTILSWLVPSFQLTPTRVKALCSPYHYSSRKIREQFGFTYPYGIGEGLKRTVLWLKDKGWL